MNQKIINARVTFRNSPIHILEKFTIKDIDNAYQQFKKLDFVTPFNEVM